MPTYEYKCTVCDERFDVVQSIEEDSLTTLADCAESNDALHHVKKVFGSVGIAFKGSGFYRNDARSSSSKESASKSTNSEQKSDSSTSDSKQSDSSSKADSGNSESSKSGKSTSSESKSSGSKDNSGGSSKSKTSTKPNNSAA